MDIQMYALRQDRPLRADERERLRAGLPQSIRFKPARKAAVKRDASLCAYAVLRAALYDLCGWETLPDMAYSERGKPYFPTYPGVHFSLSHSYGCILVGVHDRPLGVDIERFRPVRAERLRRVLGAETEEDFWRRWTEYESRCKRRGIGAAGQKGLLLPPVPLHLDAQAQNKRCSEGAAAEGTPCAHRRGAVTRQICKKGSEEYSSGPFI